MGSYSVQVVNQVDVRFSVVVEAVHRVLLVLLSDILSSLDFFSAVPHQVCSRQPDWVGNQGCGV